MTSSAGVVHIRAHSRRPDELAIVSRLVALRRAHDVHRFERTSEVVVDADCAIPHSHPVLTLNVDYPDDDDLLLAYLHEQLHWWGIENPRSQHPFDGEVYAWLRSRHPEMTDPSDILHLHICWLELEAGAVLIGDERAISTVTSRHHYQPIYRAVIDERAELRERFEADGLGLPAA